MAFYKRKHARKSKKKKKKKASAVRCKCLLLYSSQLYLNLFDCVQTCLSLIFLARKLWSQETNSVQLALARQQGRTYCCVCADNAALTPLGSNNRQQRAPYFTGVPVMLHHTVYIQGVVRPKTSYFTMVICKVLNIAIYFLKKNGLRS